MQLSKLIHSDCGTRAIPQVRLFIYNVCFGVSNIDIDEAVKYLISVQQGGKSQTVNTLNWEMVARAYMSRKYRNALSQAIFYVPDGASIVMWMRMLINKGDRIPTRVAGVDLVEKILNLIKGSNTNVGIVGGQGHQKTLEILGFPLSQVPMIWDGPICEGDQLQLKQFAEIIQSSNVQFLFLAVPSNKQNWLMPQLHKLCPNTTILGVGGTFDYLGKRKLRAPLFLQSINLEWLWRLTTEPRTAFRYLVIYPSGLTLFVIDHLINPLFFIKKTTKND